MRILLSILMLDKNWFEIQSENFLLIFLFTKFFSFKSTNQLFFNIEFTSSETSVPEPTAQPDVDVPVKSDEPLPSKPEEVEVQPPTSDDQSTTVGH